MAELQRSANFVYFPGQNVPQTLRHAEAASDEEAAPARPVLRPGVKSVPEKKPESAHYAANMNQERESPLNQQEQLFLREQIIKEYDALRQQYIAEGEKFREDAKQWAGRLTETTQNDIRKLYEITERECAEAKKNADEQGFKDGYERGYSEGSERGYSEGYNKGLRKCKATMEELLSRLEYIDAERERFFKEHENHLFDSIFAIANKITVDSLKQKDKAVISKMLREAAKGFRNSEFVKVTLSKLDVEKMGSAGVDTLTEIFRETQHIEFEVVKDAPAGTLILDSGSEITDAGVATQLMMIEKLGKGKFRDKSEDSE